jgi:hypothetical protein
LLCSQCNKNKDSRYIDKESGICKVCSGSGSKSVKGGSISGSTMIGKRAAPEKKMMMKKNEKLFGS